MVRGIRCWPDPAVVSVDLMVQALCVQEVPITGLAENVLIQAVHAGTSASPLEK